MAGSFVHEHTPREYWEELEFERLAPHAIKSAQSLGRARFEGKCPLRTEFQRDRDRITHSKSFRRLMHKTQVFISPEGDHYRTRLSHTLEVAQIARTIARALRLNEDLAEAIALGHDLGHTPFGHTGEDALNTVAPGGFRHNEQSVRVVCLLEKKGMGLNLTYEVIDGIENHRTGGRPMTLEGRAVQISDKIAYVNHDIDDAERAGMLSEGDLPDKSVKLLGGSKRARINYLVNNVIETSFGSASVTLAPEAETALNLLRDFLFGNIYRSPVLSVEREKINDMLGKLYKYYIDDTLRLPAEFRDMIKAGRAADKVVCDYIAGMTDRFAMKAYMDVFVPSSWEV